MSRFFDALREAARSGQLPESQNPVPPEEQIPTPADWGLLDGRVSEAPVPSLADDAPAPAGDPSSKAADGWGTTAAGAWDQTEELFQAFEPLKEDVSATTAKVSLDLTARLIPNTIDPTVVEHYRRLRTKILQQQSTMPFKTLVVTSPNPQEGKSVTVMNLGLSMAMLPDYKVLIVDGDLRRGSLGRWLGVEDQPGLSNLVAGSATIENTIFKCEDRQLYFMLRGTSEVPPAELLQSPQLSSVFRRLGESFDMILVDSPPVNLMADAQLLVSACDAVLLIARAYSTNRKGYDKAVQDLRPFRIIGVVLNGGTRARASSRYKGYYIKE